MDNPKGDPPAKSGNEQRRRKIYVERKILPQSEADRQGERKADRAPTKDPVLVFFKP